MITEPARLTGRHQRLDEGDRGKAASLEVDIEHVVPVGLAHLKQLHPRIDAGVVDQDVGRAQHAGGIRNHHVDVGKPRDIGADKMDTATDLADARCDPFGRRLVIEPGDRDVGPLLGQRDCNGGANSLLRAGHQRDPACQFHELLPQSPPGRQTTSDEKSGSPQSGPGWAHSSIIQPTSADDKAPISATNTILARGNPGAGVPAGASVARPPANWNTNCRPGCSTASNSPLARASFGASLPDRRLQAR